MTVSRVINQAASDIGQSFDALPEHLMMDEFKVLKMLSKNEFYLCRCCIAPHRRCVAIVVKIAKRSFYRYSLNSDKKSKQ